MDFSVSKRAGDRRTDRHRHVRYPVSGSLVLHTGQRQYLVEIVSSKPTTIRGANYPSPAPEGVNSLDSVNSKWLPKN